MGGGSVRKKASKRLISMPNGSPHHSMAPNSSPPNVNFRKISLIFLIVSVVCLVLLLSILPNRRSAFESGAHPIELHTVEVVNEFPHDPSAFTQGLLYAGNDTLFESTGLTGRSSVRKVNLQTGKIEDIQKLQDIYFGEGLTLLGERLYQVTWLKNIGFIYDRYNLSNVQMFTHQMHDGWGLATDGTVLFGSDGTSTLYHMDPQTMKVTSRQTVKYKGVEVPNLNELEYVNDEVWANVWTTDCIARISYKDGAVLGWILLPKLREGLLAAGRRGIDVLNGIAWDPNQDRIFVTGKLWPKLYEIKLHPIKTPFSGDLKQICIPEAANFERP